MGLVSNRSQTRKADRLREGVPVHDVFEIKASYQLGHPEGVVVVLKDFPDPDSPSLVGKMVRIVTETGGTVRASIAETRDHGATISLFFNGLSKESIPISSLVFLDE